MIEEAVEQEAAAEARVTEETAEAAVEEAVVEETTEG